MSRLPVLLLSLLLSACGTEATGSSGPAAPSAQQERLAAFATVARHVYADEVHGSPVRLSLRRIARDPRLVHALATGDRAALRAEALRQLFLPGYHVVRIRITRGARVLTDVGGRYVVAGPAVALQDGATLRIAIQDVLGFAKLVHRYTGADVVVRGRPGHVVAIPARAPAGGRTLDLTERGFGGESLRVRLTLPR